LRVLGDGDTGISWDLELALGTRETKYMSFFGSVGIGGLLGLCVCTLFFGKDEVISIQQFARKVHEMRVPAFGAVGYLVKRLEHGFMMLIHNLNTILRGNFGDCFFES
jgi:hypothetical protein